MRSLGISKLALPALLMMASALPSFANFATASGTVTCTGYHLEFTGDVDFSGASWTIDYSFTLHPASGSDVVVTGTVAIPQGSGFQSFDITVDKNLVTPLAQVYTITSSTATLKVNGSTQESKNITFTSNIVTCGGTVGACPATIGYWKHHTFPNSVTANGLTIGGLTYNAGQLLTILNGNGGNAVVIVGRQLVGALINQAAGGIDNPAADSAILTSEALIAANNLDLTTSDVAPSSALGQALIAQATILNGYNNGDFNTCQEP